MAYPGNICGQFGIQPEWAITIYYMIMMFGCAVTMKLSNVFVAKGFGRELWTFLAFAPVLSLKGWRARRPLVRRSFFRSSANLSILGGAMSIYYLFAVEFLAQAEINPMLLAYICILPFWLLVETIGAWTEISLAPFGIHLPPINHAPWLSQSLSEFWGRRWNRVFGDWCYQTCFRPLRRRPTLAMCSTFTISGVIHEIIVSVPLWVVYRRNVFGFMMAYFLMQAFSVWLERRYLKHTWSRRFLMWSTLIMPAPLLFNEGTLRVFHLVAV
jgi:hypothetical protein